jgi:hypothetical protein
MKRIENLSTSAQLVLLENLTGGANSYKFTEYNGGINPATGKEFATQEEYAKIIVNNFLNDSEWQNELINELHHDINIIGSDDPELVAIYTEIIAFIEGLNNPDPDTLVLNKCAYIFHWSNNNFAWSRQQSELKAKIQKILKRYNDNWSSSERIPYIIKDNTVYIEVDGIEIAINDKMIYCVYGQHPRKNIINGIRFADYSEFVASRADCHTFCHNSIYHNSLKSLHIDIYGGDGDLRFYRIYFKGCKYICVVSGGKIYAHSDKYTEVATSDILNALDTTDKAKAGKFIYDFCEFITK